MMMYRDIPRSLDLHSERLLATVHPNLFFCYREAKSGYQKFEDKNEKFAAKNVVTGSILSFEKLGPMMSAVLRTR